MSALRLLGGLISLFIYLPWSLYLTYRILTHVKADELTWFLFWLLIPLALISGVIGKLVESGGD